MICPLRSMQWKPKPGEETHEQLGCLKEECAWWDKEQDCCVICTIAGELDALHYFAKSIRDRMPRLGAKRAISDP